jgi:very-short-patch-repair endonuclease
MPHTPLSPRHRANAKSMRKVMTDAELKLWNEIRAHQLMGLGFRRQFPIAGYIVDFACPKRKLVVEVDGSQHAEVNAATDDEVRTKRLQQDGWIILRFWNDDVIRDIDNVCQHIVIGAGLAGTSQIRAWAGHHGKAGGTVPPSVLPDISPQLGGRSAAASDFANHQRRKGSVVGEAADLPGNGEKGADRNAHASAVTGSAFFQSPVVFHQRFGLERSSWPLDRLARIG